MVFFIRNFENKIFGSKVFFGRKFELVKILCYWIPSEKLFYKKIVYKCQAAELESNNLHNFLRYFSKKIVSTYTLVILSYISKVFLEIEVSGCIIKSSKIFNLRES